MEVFLSNGWDSGGSLSNINVAELSQNIEKHQWENISICKEKSTDSVLFLCINLPPNLILKSIEVMSNAKFVELYTKSSSGTDAYDYISTIKCCSDLENRHLFSGNLEISDRSLSQGIQLKFVSLKNTPNSLSMKLLSITVLNKNSNIHQNMNNNSKLNNNNIESIRIENSKLINPTQDANNNSILTPPLLKHDNQSSNHFLPLSSSCNGSSSFPIDPTLINIIRQDIIREVSESFELKISNLNNRMEKLEQMINLLTVNNNHINNNDNNII